MHSPTDQIKCPKCGSTQITTQKKGFSIGQALVFGVAGGFVGSRNVEITCLNCGKRFWPGDYRRAQEKIAEKQKWDSLTEEQKAARQKDDMGTAGMFLFVIVSVIALLYFWRFIIPGFIILTVPAIVIDHRIGKDGKRSLPMQLMNNAVGFFWIVSIPIFLLIKGVQYIVS